MMLGVPVAFCLGLGGLAFIVLSGVVVLRAFAPGRADAPERRYENVTPGRAPTNVPLPTWRHSSRMASLALRHS